MPKTGEKPTHGNRGGNTSLNKNMQNNINLKQLADFLEEANKSTYANKDAPKASPSRLKSEDYHFEKGGLVYHDTYFGSHDFIGEEIVYENNKPIWGANYYGYVTKAEVLEKDVYNFLRQALMQKNINTIPVRGPTRYTMGQWTYANAIDGGLDRFGGTETIFCNDAEVYRCWYHGGIIK